MKKFHALSGLPRSGTTLLGNILAQHPDVYVSGTSSLSPCIEQIINVLSTSPEIQSDLAAVPGSYERYSEAIRGLVRGWYSDRKEPVIIDKGRGWIMFQRLLRQLYPTSTLIVCVRDPRDVFASVEARDGDTALFWSQFGRTATEAADVLFRPEGNIGGPMRFCEDLIRRNLDVCWVRYETFVQDPEESIGQIAKQLKLSPHKWDFKNIKNVATDLDAIHRGKFPHDGSGAIKAPKTSWRDTLDPELAQRIAASYPLYMKTFDYID